jgi:hypothetical protein
MSNVRLVFVTAFAWVFLLAVAASAQQAQGGIVEDSSALPTVNLPEGVQQSNVISTVTTYYGGNPIRIAIYNAGNGYIGTAPSYYHGIRFGANQNDGKIRMFVNNTLVFVFDMSKMEYTVIDSNGVQQTIPLTTPTPTTPVGITE